ncbi:type III pantothenate kinase [Campylobacter sp. RM10532]|uniref:Type III pantothenate kinase n=1 Tax=Campylobacter molothri TaxID=1032242 RepID=A0ACC5W074_9BACT|nr:MULTISPECIES: type III pantothenate kinase [unclassified Campylobacter]MBZ7927810.1 type III pantothenate kinase [Campylobacter sp. RM10542]MBZ7929762.1 type III pantothenate kinase [Campylobacter sp. W0067]MBZ7931148.1 type III pantothenate kinase [Campylobacter sp. RM12910]MBZ7932742.1 type III pantothenate kinase [Campylobacter sp. RM10543]MBZ7936936.1 type III pantothenate kinase [Campylobacter sp. RM10538]MBZ7939961.1 type III pantothenate kinase [Campylobacter sp. W0047]MBZ7943818.1
MLFCDIGNSNANFLEDHKYFTLSIEQFLEYKSEQKIFYINVNENLKNHLKARKNFIDLEPFFVFDTIYQGLGIDRIAACYTIDDGVIVDAGSAITIDIIANSIHLGGFILPGITNFRKIYAHISPRLKYEFNTQVSFDAFPQKTKDALSYGVFKSIYLLIKDTAQNKKLYFTGGDGQFLANYFDNAIYDKLLVFRGMKKIIQENPNLLI